MKLLIFHFWDYGIEVGLETSGEDDACLCGLSESETPVETRPFWSCKSSVSG